MSLSEKSESLIWFMIRVLSRYEKAMGIWVFTSFILGDAMV